MCTNGDFSAVFPDKPGSVLLQTISWINGTGTFFNDAGCSFCHPNISIKALRGTQTIVSYTSLDLNHSCWIPVRKNWRVGVNGVPFTLALRLLPKFPPVTFCYNIHKLTDKQNSVKTLALPVCSKSDQRSALRGQIFHVDSLMWQVWVLSIAVSCSSRAIMPLFRVEWFLLLQTPLQRLNSLQWAAHPQNGPWEG